MILGLLSDLPLFWILFDISFITWSCSDGGAGGVLTTDRRRPSHRWGDSETHPPSAPHWPALSTSRWAARVWTRIPPSEGKEGGRGELRPEPNEDKWGKRTEKRRGYTHADGSQTDNERNEWAQKTRENEERETRYTHDEKRHTEPKKPVIAKRNWVMRVIRED